MKEKDINSSAVIDFMVSETAQMPIKSPILPVTNSNPVFKVKTIKEKVAPASSPFITETVEAPFKRKVTETKPQIEGATKPIEPKSLKERAKEL